MESTQKDSMHQNSFENELNDFLHNIRLGGNQQDPEPNKLNLEEGNARQDEMKMKAQDRIIQAEKFRAEVQAPKGKPFYITIESEDDKFLHVTCHIEEALKVRIKKGEFVELEKLLPKQNLCGYGEEQNRMNLFHKEGETYFAPVQGQEIENSEYPHLGQSI